MMAVSDNKPTGWDAGDWAIWARRIQVFFSERGAKLDRIMLASEVEASIMNVHMREGDAVVSVDKSAKLRLMGIPVMFTNKLPLEKALFLSTYQKEKK